MKRINPPCVVIKTLLLFVLLSNTCLAQETEPESFKPRIRGAIMMANSHVPKAIEGEKKVTIIPAWGFDVDYVFHKRWSVALQGDIKLQSFEIENKDVILERSYPVALAGVLHFHCKRNWSFYLGPGYEFEQHENFFLVKVGMEYSFEITEDFEIALNLAYENKEEVYDGITFGIAFNKKLWEKK